MGLKLVNPIKLIPALQWVFLDILVNIYYLVIILILLIIHLLCIYFILNILASVLASYCYYDKLLQLVGFNNSKFIFLEYKTPK